MYYVLHSSHLLLMQEWARESFCMSVTDWAPSHVPWSPSPPPRLVRLSQPLPWGRWGPVERRSSLRSGQVVLGPIYLRSIFLIVNGFANVEYFFSKPTDLPRKYGQSVTKDSLTFRWSPASIGPHSHDSILRKWTNKMEWLKSYKQWNSNFILKG